jgi:hypothetical protein
LKKQTSLVQLKTEEANRRVGNGLLCLLSLPGGSHSMETMKAALELNDRELGSLTRAHFLGSWCSGHTGLTYVSFVPNILCDITFSGLGRTLLENQMMRAKWVAEEVYGDHWPLSSQIAQPAIRRAGPGFWKKFFGQKAG